jgi:hypothetical protein
MPDLTPADELRAAAQLMRGRAGKATPGPWSAMVLGSEGYLVLKANSTVRDRGKHRVGRFGLKDWDSDKADAEYVASMGPDVAVALADALDAAADWLSAEGDSWAHEAARSYGRQLADILAPAVKENPGD